MCGGRVEGGLSQCTAHWLYGSWENSAICTRSVLETKKVHLLLNHTMLVSSGWRITGPLAESGFSQGFLFTISFTDWVWDLCHCRFLACLVGDTWYMAIYWFDCIDTIGWELSGTIHCCFLQSYFTAELSSVCITETLFSYLTRLICFETCNV